MRFILPLLLLIIIALYLWDRSWDRQFFLWLNTSIPLTLPDSLIPVWDVTMVTLTTLGDTHVMLWIIFLVFLQNRIATGKEFAEKKSLYLLVFAVVLVLAIVMSRSLKELVGALRPASVMPHESLRILGDALRNYSFPSGHTITAFAGITMLLPIIPASWRWGALIFAAGIGYSRIGVGAHWPIDVAAGAFLGIVAGMMGWRIALWLQAKRFTKNEFWKKLYQGLAILGAFILVMNIAYTPFHELEHRSIRLGLIVLCITLALFLGYHQRARLQKNSQGCSL